MMMICDADGRAGGGGGGVRRGGGRKCGSLAKILSTGATKPRRGDQTNTVLAVLTVGAVEIS